MLCDTMSLNDHKFVELIIVTPWDLVRGNCRHKRLFLGIVATGNYRYEIIHVIYSRKALGTRKSETIIFFASRQIVQRDRSQ